MRRGYVRLGKEQGEGLPGSTDHDEGIDRVTRCWLVGLINIRVPDLVLCTWVSSKKKTKKIGIGPRQGQRSLFFFFLRPGEEVGWGQLGPFQRHMSSWAASRFAAARKR